MTDDTLRRAITTSMELGLDFANAYLLEPERALEAETWRPEDLQSDERSRLLQLIHRGAEFTPDELSRHLGQPPIDADRRTHIIIAEQLRRYYPHCYVVGEEASDDEWDAALEAPIGALIFQIDAIDGSMPYDTLTFGYSVNLLAYERGMETDRLLATAIANSSGFFALYEEDYGASVGTLKQQQTISEPQATDFRSETIAAVGATPQHRALIAELLRDDSLTVFTAAGAPAALGMLVGRLGVLVATKEQTTHDAAFLPIMSSIGLPILVDNGLVLGLDDVKNYFAFVARAQNDRSSRPIPRFVIARNPVFGASIARLLFR